MVMRARRGAGEVAKGRVVRRRRAEEEEERDEKVGRKEVRNDIFLFFFGCWLLG